MAPELPNLPNRRRNRATNFFGGGQRGLSPIIRPGRTNRFVRPATPRIAAPQTIQSQPQRGSRDQTNIQSGSPTRFGKANGIDYLNFFGSKKNTKILKKAIVRLKDLLVEGFKVAKGLRASIANIVEQLKGFGGKAAKGFGILGIIAAIVAAVGALFGPQIRATYDWVVEKGGQILTWIQGAAENFKAIWNTISDLAGRLSFGLIQIPQFEGPDAPMIEDDLGSESNISEPSALSGIGNFLNLGNIGSVFNNQNRSTSAESSSGSTAAPASAPSGGSRTQSQVAQTLVSEFKEQGLSSEGAKLATAEIGRENSLNRDLILGSHMDGPNRAYGAVSWQGGREKVLFDELEKRGIQPTAEGLANSGDEGIRANAAAMIREIQNRGHSELLGLLKKQNLTDDDRQRVRYLMKNQYFIYNKKIPLSRSEEWYNRIDNFGLQSAAPRVVPPAQRTARANITSIVLPASQQVASAPSRPQQVINPSASTSSGTSPTIAFYDPSNADSFSSLSSKMTYNIVG